MTASSHREEFGIFIHHEELLPELPDEQILTSWILRVLSQESHKLQCLHFVFMDDASLLKINREHLDHDALTDVITFPYQTDPVDAEVYISADRVRDNANLYHVAVQEELLRVMIHGVLHACGWSDHTAEDKSLMHLREDACLALLCKMDYPLSPSSPSYVVFSASAE